MKKLFTNFLIFFVIFLVLAGIFSSFGAFNQDKPEKKGFNFLISSINSGEITKIEVDGSEVVLTNSEDVSYVVKKEPSQSLSALLDDLDVNKEQLSNIDIVIQDQSTWDFWLINILPFLIPFLLIGGFIYFMMRGAQGANSRAMMFGQVQTKEAIKEKNPITFKDVAGAKEAKEELQEVVEFLKFPKKFHDLGATIPKGVLLLGSPGTGKTLLARSVSGEAKVPFFHISGSEFVEMFVGVGASRVRSLFQKAKKNTPCIIFIDEIDAVGRKRGAGLGGSHDEREQTLNQILVEMDGFDKHDNIIIIAATNRPDVLDPALLRPGRFDRQIIIDQPDIADREAILRVHVKKKPLASSVNLRSLAERTPGFSGADLANLLNEGAILAARKNKKQIDMEELFEAIEKVMIGPERKSRVISEKERKITAFHEAGHAIVAHFLPHTDPVQKISIIARGRAGGYTLKVPTEDKHMHPKSEFVEEISVLLAGYLAEKKIFKEVTTGATSDLRRATAISKKLITDYGMSSSLGLRTFGDKEDMIFLGREIHEQRDYSEKIAEKIDEEISDIISKARKIAERILDEREGLLRQVSKVLLEKETLDNKEFEEIVGKKIGLNSK